MSMYSVAKTRHFSVWEINTSQDERKPAAAPSAVAIQYGKKLSLEDFTMVAVQKNPVTVDTTTLERLQIDYDTYTSRYVKNLFEGNNLNERGTNRDNTPYDVTVSRAALLFEIMKIIHGRFGVRPLVVHLLVEMLNKNVIPVLRSSVNPGAEIVDVIKKSFTAECFTPVGPMRCDEAFNHYDVQVTALSQNEISFFFNNEFLTTASATLFVSGVSNIASTLDAIASLSCEAGGINISSFDADQYEEFRQHRGQMISSANIRSMLEGSRQCTASSNKELISMKHIPQVHGPVHDTLQICRKTIERELISSEACSALSEWDKLNPTQSVLAAKHAYDALTIALSASHQRMDDLLGKFNSMYHCAVPEYNEKNPVGFLRKVSTGFMDEMEASLQILEGLEVTISRTYDLSQREDKQVEYIPKKHINANGNLTADQLAKIEMKRRAKQDKAKEKAKNKSSKKAGIALGVGSTTMRKSVLNVIANSSKPTLDPFDVGKNSFVTFCRSLLESLNCGGKRRLRIPKGTRDFTPEQMRIREKVLAVIRNVFKRHGAVEIDTPVFEMKEILTGKYGEDSKLIYDLADQGGDMLSLRYDLTVPFARFLAMNSVGNIKRYHIAKVYRRDNPVVSKGRYREFYQCDFDIAGAYTRMVSDAEVITIATEILSSLPVGEYRVKLNHRKLLDAVFEIAAVPHEKFRPICSAVDKLDKMSWVDVKAEMVNEKGISEGAADIIGEFVMNSGKPYDLLSKLIGEDTFAGNDGALNALEDLNLLFGYLEAMDSLQFVSFDLSLARGLDYYTGVIYEVVLIDGSNEMGSIAAGGRYDNLVGMFSPLGQETPCVGVSIGVERVFTIIEKQITEVGSSQTPNIQVFIASIGAGYISHRMALARLLWKSNIPAEYSHMEDPKFKRQLDDTLVRGIPFMIIFGEEEVSNGVVIVKDVKKKKEHKVEKKAMVATLLDLGCVPLTEVPSNLF